MQTQSLQNHRAAHERAILKSLAIPPKLLPMVPPLPAVPAPPALAGGGSKPALEIAEAEPFVMTEADRLDHAKDEAIIALDQAAFLAAGAALRRIRDRKSYLATHSTLEEYALARWGWGRSQAYRLIAASEVAMTISVFSEVVPENESQVRPLLTVPADKIQCVWEKVVSRPPTEPLTAKVIAQAAKPFQKKPVRVPVARRVDRNPRSAKRS